MKTLITIGVIGYSFALLSYFQYSSKKTKKEVIQETKEYYKNNTEETIQKVDALVKDINNHIK